VEAILGVHMGEKFFDARKLPARDFEVGPHAAE
jgi:hypothetical protein